MNFISLPQIGNRGISYINLDSIAYFSVIETSCGVELKVYFIGTEDYRLLYITLDELRILLSKSLRFT